jgi:hypothetical protein
MSSEKSIQSTESNKRSFKDKLYRSIVVMLVFAITLVTVRALADHPIDPILLKEKIQKLEKAREYHSLKIRSVYHLIEEVDQRIASKLNKFMQS